MSRVNILDPNKLDVVPNLADTLFLDDDQDAPNAPGTDDLIRFDVVGDLTELGAYGANFNNCVSQYFLRQAERSISAIHAIAVRRMRIEPTTHIPEVRLLFFPRLGSP